MRFVKLKGERNMGREIGSEDFRREWGHTGELIREINTQLTPIFR
jgi:hypothetical protein